MPTFEYGSKPLGEYGHRDFVKYLAPQLPSDDKVFRCSGSFQWRDDQGDVSMDFFRSLCYWKSPRPKKKVEQEDIEKVRCTLAKAFKHITEHACDDDGIQQAMTTLCKLQGVGCKTASVLLTAWNPEQFGIIDFKVLRVLELSEKGDTKKDYVVFLRALRKLRQELGLTCTLRQIELALWHYFRIQDEGQRSFS